jgi:hypothetical protein
MGSEVEAWPSDEFEFKLRLLSELLLLPPLLLLLLLLLLPTLLS